MVSFIISNFQKFQSVILVLIPQEVNDVHCCPSLFWGYSLVQLITAESAVLTFLNVFHTIYKFPNVLQRYSSIAIIWQFTHSFMKYNFFFTNPITLTMLYSENCSCTSVQKRRQAFCLALPCPQGSFWQFAHSFILVFWQTPSPWQWEWEHRCSAGTSSSLASAPLGYLSSF